MKRYLVFAGDDYYPAGGADDLDSCFDDHAAATERAQDLGRGEYRWAHVYDTHTGKLTRVRG